MSCYIVAAVASLRRAAGYELETPLADRMQELLERKEFLGAAEHRELLALAEFTQRRTIEKLEAELALKRLGEFLPDLLARQ
ncbi:MAG TPA: hypothetical protein VG326_13240 [Tepidisphaeraceae bacterium]|jgi:hypothetical protein|nr:hypothetical protein [Tepidisphaeraceae bacterium]